MGDRCEDLCTCGRAMTEEGDRAAEVETVAPLSEIEQLRADLAYAQADARHWHEACGNLNRVAREYFLKARDGERLRGAVRALEQNAHAGLIHWSGESVDVVRADDLRVALDGARL